MDIPLSEAFIFLSFLKGRPIWSFSATHCKLKHPVGYGRFSEGNAQEGSGLRPSKI